MNKENELMYDVIIIGAGASGLVASIVAARRGKKVLILEKNNKVGKKLLATGNGRCNITNVRPTPERFYSHYRDFIIQVLEEHGYQKVKQFFKSIGLELLEAKEGKVFPLSLQASSVVDLLLYECEQLGVKIVCNVNVTDVNKISKGYEVCYSQGCEKSYSLLIATGHQSAPKLGGVGDGAGFSHRFGHHLFTPFPSLVQLTSPMKNLKKIAGVKVESRVTLDVNKRQIVREGDLLFTSYGLSGLVILDISRFVLEALIHTPYVTLEIDLMPKLSCEQLGALMRKSLKKKSPKPLRIWMQGFMNKKLILPILEPLGLDQESVGYLAWNRNKLEALVDQIKGFKVKIDGSRGFDGAEVVAGGVDTREINPKTMESKLHNRLYLTGEVLDVDGDRGGFNLHFAWISGMRAGAAF